MTRQTRTPCATCKRNGPDRYSYTCAQQAAEERAAAKRTKPAGYTWPLYNEPRRPVSIPTTHLRRTTHPLPWVAGAFRPAWRRMAAEYARQRGTYYDDASDGGTPQD